MAEAKRKKPYAAEIKTMAGTPGTGPGPEPGTAISEETARRRHAEVMAAFEAMRDHLRHLPAAPAAPIAAPEGLDVGTLKKELQQLRNAISETKREIAALRHPAAPSSDRLVTATDELDAVVKATESATHTILETAESLEEVVQRVAQSSPDTFVAKSMDDMKEMIVRMYEACNFQDVTGQRINKVVNTMRYVEEHVNTMISIFGTDAFQEIEVPTPAKPADKDKALLEGPQLPENAVSQDDIDKLFS
ncbi:MAG: protein phosphatase CheZ [Alphaproteobacteria bacterium]